MKIVLTGGPSAGKTTIAEILVRECCDRLLLVPEGASILFRGGFPRQNSKDAVACLQRAIFHVQHELEELKTLQRYSRSLICDRGTLDGLAYWPKSPEEFFTEVGSSMTAEVARYDWVIHLDTADQDAYQASVIRTESYIEASLINERVKQAWRAHPRRVILSNNKNFATKINLAVRAVKMMLDGEPYEKVAALMSEA
jgi:hypothetical protein